MAPRPIASIETLTPYKGGDSKLPGFDRPIKLASNENPLGASPAAVAAFQAAAGRLHLYPEGSARLLREALGQTYGLEADRIVCGSGSDELFQLLARAYLEPGDDIVQSEHAFLVYRLVAQTAGAAVHSAKDRAYTVDVDGLLAAVTPKTKMVFLANPNNPTGTYVPRGDVERLWRGLPPEVLLVIDAAYAEFVDAADYEAGIELARAAPNVLMTRTFSKIHGLAALRLGWAYGPAPVIEVLNRVRGPFNIGSPAQAAGVAALADTGFAAESARVNRDTRAKLAAGLDALGLEQVPSVANFILVRFPDQPGKTAAEIDQKLRAQGYIVRRMEAYGLVPFLRISVGTEAENSGFLTALAQALHSP